MYLSSMLALSVSVPAALAQAGQAPLPDVQQQARVTGLLLQLGPSITSLNCPAHSNPRARKTRLTLKLSLTSSHTGRQRPGQLPPLSGDKSLFAPSLRSAPPRSWAREGRRGQPGAVQLSSGPAGAGPGRAAPGGRSGVRAGPPLSVGAEPPPCIKGEPRSSSAF